MRLVCARAPGGDIDDRLERERQFDRRGCIVSATLCRRA
jgi:hypothetical protein